ncbi:MAG: hypothetical protein K9M98_08425 [Cephaloticoccus sp.]|nr:hypothetical protein [Cephaloticoccus sp.]MCF7760515.1 hypothetical protein [Cephaloticoccus sp.]
MALGLLFSPRAVATTVVPPEFSELAGRSDYVVRGRVLATNSEWRIKGNSRRIFTRVEVEVLEVIAGQPPAHLVLECLGGRVGDEELVVDGSPVFVVGQESILFVSGNGRALCPLYAMNYGFYPVQEEAGTKRRYVARGNQVPLENVAEVAQPLLAGEDAAAQRLTKLSSRALTPAEFVQEIKLVARANSSRATSN